MNRNAKIFVAGGRGMVGSAVVRALNANGYTRVLSPRSAELDLRNQKATRSFFETERPDAVIIAAAKVGGIHANNQYPVEFLLENLQIECNTIQSAAETGTERLLFLGSSCIYPKLSRQPIREDSLLTGALEPTNEAYAIAKIAGLKLCEYYFKQYGKRFISAMPTNLYGPGDSFHPENSHVIPGLMRRMHEAKISSAHSVTVWGSGTPFREFLHVDDLARALVMLLESYYAPETINVGVGSDLSIRELAEMIRKTVGFAGEIVWDSTKPDGTPKKLLDHSKITALGWKPEISLEDGLKSTYQWAIEHGSFTDSHVTDSHFTDSK